MSRRLISGRFDTREELEECVRFMWEFDRSKADIARNVRVSESLVAQIIKRRYK